MNARSIENAERLAGALSRHTDGESLKLLAKTLHYNEAQLVTDIQALFSIINQIDIQKGS